MKTTKRTGFFKVSMRKLRIIASETKSPDLLAGFLVMARYGTSNIIADRPPYTFSGAGANAIKKIGVGESKANGILDKLQEYHFIKPISKDIKIPAKDKKQVRYELLQDEFDLDLPHALIDGLSDIADAPIKRIGQIINNRTELANVSEDELRLETLLLLLEIYKATNMEQYGGINPSFLFRQWETDTRRAKDGNFEWFATAKADQVFTNCLKNAFRHLATISGKGANKTLVYPENISERFWNAMENLKRMGLIYEAVTMLDVDSKNSLAKAICTIRVNDYHAGVGSNSSDPSLLVYDENGGFYTQGGNDRGEPEQMRFRWPNKKGSLIGIYRPRFRAINQDSGIWLDREKSACAQITTILQEQDETCEV